MLLTANIQTCKPEGITLPADLHVRYNALQTVKARQIFVLSFWLKTCLADLLGLKEYTIVYNAYGKPYIRFKSGLCNFSMAHHDDAVFLYYKNNQPVGLDVLNIKKVKLSSLTCEYFSPEEQAYAQDGLTFCQVWLAKEAYGKFQGRGLYPELRGVNLLPLWADWFTFWVYGEYTLCLKTMDDQV
jgi:phosphopantetheinyl transferase